MSGTFTVVAIVLCFLCGHSQGRVQGLQTSKEPPQSASKSLIFYDTTYAATPDPDTAKQWCINTRFELTVSRDGKKLAMKLRIADQEIKGYLASTTETSSASAFNYRSMDRIHPVDFGIKFSQFLDYKHVSGQAEILDREHVLSKWYDVTGCFADHPILWTEK